LARTASGPVEPYVVAQPRQYSPYGARTEPPRVGIAAKIENDTTQGQVCDLVKNAVSRSVVVVDAAGKPVSGAKVTFEVSKQTSGTRTDGTQTDGTQTDATPQYVTDLSDVDGFAWVTVVAPKVRTKNPTPYQITAEVETGQGFQTTSFTIDNFTCKASAHG
jgi:hypothetical protein